MKKVVVIGAGFSGLSVASFMAKAGWDVTVLEKHSMPGGRARKLEASGYTFDMGPSWYWMPDVFERYFSCFGKNVSEYYELERLDPSYRIYWHDGQTDIPADYNELKKLFESIEKGSGEKLDAFLKEAAYKYEVGINKLVYKPGQSLTEFLDWDTIKGVFKLDVFTSIEKHIGKFFKHPKLRQLMEFPVLFLGALAKDTPALYSLMNYADIKLGTWYPKKGMYAVVDGMYRLATELGVKFFFDHNVTAIDIEEKLARSVTAQTSNIEHQASSISFDADVVIGSADYHFIETSLLSKEYRTYSDKYWDKRLMAPSCLLYYVGLNKKLEGVPHHSLFFDANFDVHGSEIYETKQWPADPLFYLSVSSVTDETVAPAGCDNMVFLIPVASGLTGDDEDLKEKYFKKIVERFENKTGQIIKNNIVYKKNYSVSNFITDYNSFKGNAYGLANTLMQTAVLRPSCRSIKIKNLFYTGQLTVPGPGVPPSLISGEVVAKEIVKNFG